MPKEKREVEATWFHGNTLVFKFRGVDTISDAELLYGREVRVPASERTVLDAGEYFQSGPPKPNQPGQT